MFSFDGDRNQIVTSSSIANHSYSSAGAYNVQASANDSDHHFSALVIVEIQGIHKYVYIIKLQMHVLLDVITCVNVASFITSSDVTFLVDYCGNKDPNYGTVTYHWDFGDNNTAISRFPSITYHYQAPRIWTYTLTALNAVSKITFTGSVIVVSGTVQK